MQLQTSLITENQKSQKQLAKARYARQWMTVALVLTDLASLLLAFSFAILMYTIFFGQVPFSQFYFWGPFLVLFIVAFAWRGLYPAVGLNPVDELRLITSTISVVCLILLAGTFWFSTIETHSWLIFILVWFLSLVFVQVNRWLLRVIGRSAWGESVVVIGDGSNTEQIVSYLLNNNHLGMRPVMVLKGQFPPDQVEREALLSQRINTVILVTPEVSEEVRDLVVNDGQFGFQRVILISPLGWVGSLGVVAHDLEGILGMEVRKNLLNFWQRSIKRGLDILLSIILLILISPLLLMVSIAIKLEDKGNVFYKQRRVGRNGCEYVMWKFRTMVPDAEQKLHDYLLANAEYAREWDANQKLKNDPRLTRVGRVLRKWSLDELPQLINVIRGEMSLVGPRPFFSEQAGFYGKVLNLYYQVRPGMTGMWQVSGRNDTDYARRVRLDEYYIRNWSFWLDIYILLRTIWIILRREGAY